MRGFTLSLSCFFKCFKNFILRCMSIPLIRGMIFLYALALFSGTYNSHYCHDVFGHKVFGHDVFDHDVFGYDVLGHDVFGHDVFGRDVFGPILLDYLFLDRLSIILIEI